MEGFFFSLLITKLKISKDKIRSHIPWRFFIAFLMKPLIVHGNAFLINFVYSFGLSFEVWIGELFCLFITEIWPMIIYIIFSNYAQRVP